MMHHGCETGAPRMRPVCSELSADPGLWNEHRLRTADPRSPHREIDDIWGRYNALANLDPANPAAFNEPHAAEWYPVAAKLPSLQPFVEALAHALGAATIGGVLITRVPAGKQVYWHRDAGWHAQEHRKFCVSIAANHEQTFEFEREQMRSDTGDCFEFDNAFPHRVLNPAATARVSLIVSLRGFKP
jgi:hypothetical protein